jgi:hypothetical protein
VDTYVLAQTIAQKPEAGWVLRQGQVVSVQGDYTMTVTIAGAATEVPGVRYVGAPPPPGAGVWMFVSGSDVFALGALADAGRTIAPRVHRTNALTLTTTTDTTVPWETVESDPYGFWDAGSPNVLTCRVPGRYMAVADVRFAGNATGVRAGWIEVNTTTPVGRVRGAAAPSAPTQLSVVSQAFTLAANDTVRLRVEQTSGGNLDLLVAGTAPSLSLIYLGP